MKMLWNKGIKKDKVQYEIFSKLRDLPDGKWEIVIRKPKLSKAQHNSLWILAENIATALNEKHKYYSKSFFEWFYKETFEMMWDQDSVKKNIIDPIIRVYKDSMTKLTSKEASKVEEYLLAHFAKKGIILTAPSQQAKNLDLKDYEIL